MGFSVAVIYYSLHGRLVTLANVIAEGARKVPGAEVAVWRVADPVRGEEPAAFEDGVLDAPLISLPEILKADAIIVGAPGRQGGMCGEMRMFLDTWAPLQTQRSSTGSMGLLKGKVGSAFTSVTGSGRGFGGHEAILQSFHATFLQHGMVVVGSPPSAAMEDARNATPFGVVMAGKDSVDRGLALTENEVKLAYGLGLWTAQITQRLQAPLKAL